jgi:hypothetical protein
MYLYSSFYNVIHSSITLDTVIYIENYRRTLFQLFIPCKALDIVIYTSMTLFDTGIYILPNITLTIYNSVAFYVTFNMISLTLNERNMTYQCSM